MRKTKKAYFEKLNLKEIGDNKTFWKTVRPYFSDKDNKSSKITLVENNIVIADEKRVAELMNKYFINITKNLNLKALINNTIDDIQSLKSDSNLPEKIYLICCNDENCFLFHLKSSFRSQDI